VNVSQRIESRLSSLDPKSLEIRDESDLHVGHPGAKSGGGHFRLVIVSSQFSGKTIQLRHRMVYNALGAMMHKEIHALSINAYAPDEVRPHPPSKDHL